MSLAVMLGCGQVDMSPEQVTYSSVLELAPTPEAEAAVLEAIGEWNACGAIRHAAIGYGPNAVPVDVVDRSDSVLEGYDGVTTYWDGAYPLPRAIHVAHDAGSQITRHEIGHALMPWLSQTEPHFGHGLMQAVTNPDAHVTEEDCVALREGNIA